MIEMSQLAVPIVLASVLAWLASSVIHMLLKYHNYDYSKLNNEKAVAAAIREGSHSPGLYTLPHCVAMSEMNSPEMQSKFAAGPVAFVTVFPNGMPNMGKLLVQQIGFFLLGCALIGYCASLVLAPGGEYMVVFRFISAVAFLAFGWATIPFSIWYGHPWATTARFLLDALIYALVVAGVFAWLWPGVS